MYKHLVQALCLTALAGLRPASPASAQPWVEAGLPLWVPAPTVCYADTVHDWLIVASQGPMHLEGEGSFYPVLRYDGSAWDTIGLCGNPVRSAVVYHDTLLVAGSFQLMHNNPIGSIACLVNEQWHPYGNFQSAEPDGNYHGVIRRLRVVDGELYATGDFRYADGQLCKGVAKRVGGHWEPLPGWAELNFLGNPRIMDVIRFQGKLVVAGNFSFVGHNPWWTDALQYDGTAWGPICDHCLMGGVGNVAVMAEYKGELYVGGGFYYSGGNAGQGIMRWDGETWQSLGPVGGGLQIYNYSDQYTPSIGDLQVRDGLLYISGGFRYVNHQPVATGICTWDSTDFCLPEGDYFADFFMPIAFYRDTLYGAVSGQPYPPPRPDLFGLVRYTGNFSNCTTLGVEEPVGAGTALQAVWEAGSAFALLGLPDGRHRVQVYDAQGRLVMDAQVSSTAGRSEALDLHGKGAALYVALVDRFQAVKLAAIR